MATTITYTINAITGNELEGKVVSVLDSLTGINLLETFELIRTASKISELSDAIPPLQNTVAFGLKQALNLDYNSISLYEIEQSTNTVTVKALNSSSQFSPVSNTTAGVVSIAINNDVIVPKFTIDTVVISEATASPCDNVKLTITTSQQATNIVSPIISTISTNPFIVDVTREDSTKLIMNNLVNSDTDTFRVPKLLSANIQITIINTPAGATVTANRLFPLSQTGLVGFPLLLTFTHSLDDVIFVTTNSFVGIPVGAGTMFIKDNIGCKISIPFIVDAFTPNLVDFDPIVEVSNLNSFRFKRDEIITNINVRNNLNSLSFEETVGLNDRNFLQIFETIDKVPTQFKSNYETNVAVLIDDQDVETPLVITKVTANLNITDVRDGSINILTNNDIAIFFGSGNTYDPITLLVNGSYNLGEDLPDFLNVGDFVNLEGFGFIVVTTIIAPTNTHPFFDLVLGANNAQFNFAQDQILKITSVFNIVDFERFEFTVDMTALLGNFRIRIDATDTDTNFPDESFLSEWFNIDTEQEESHNIIKYFNTVNNEIAFSTGIVFILRIPYIFNLSWKDDVDNDIVITDTNTVNVESKVREQYELSFEVMPKAMAQKVILALSQDRLEIDGQNYTFEGDTSLNHLKGTNLYQLNATITLSDNVFNSISGASTGEVIIPQRTPLEIDANTRGLLFID